MKKYELRKFLCFGALLTQLHVAAAHGDGKATTNNVAAIPWSQIGAKAGSDYHGDGLAVTPTESGARLHCVFQHLDGEATPQGFWLNSSVTNTINDRFRVTAVAIGRNSANGNIDSEGSEFNLHLPDEGSVSIKGQTVRFSRPGLTEEYSVSMNGVRQDFNVEQAPPSRASGELVIKLAVTGAKVEAATDGARLALEHSGRQIAYSRLRVTDFTGKELPARIEECWGSEGTRFKLCGDTGSFSETPSLLAPDAPDVNLVVVVNDADAVYPVQVDPTFSDANWVSMGGIPGTFGSVYAAVADSSGNLYIAGDFTAAGNVFATNVAEWNGSTWSALGSGSWPIPGSGVSGYISALAVSGNTLYACGSFAMAGGTPANNIAQWNGTNWSALGSGLSGAIGGSGPDVYALAVSGSTLYAGGHFTNAGGNTANHIAQWNGSSWSALGSGMGGNEPNVVVYALAVSGDTLYAAGEFTTAGGRSANNIAQWNGSNWSALGSGTGGEAPQVFALAVSGGTLYAGGYFSTAGGVPAGAIAQWNGTNWSALGSGISGDMDRYLPTVKWLTVSGGTLYVSGSFATAGTNTNANGVAQWDGTNWSPLDPGISGPGGAGYNLSVSVLAASGSTLYLGIISPNDVPFYEFTGIAQWNGTKTSWLGSTGLNGPVSALAVSGNTVYASGEFTMAGGLPANAIAQWNGTNWFSFDSGLNGVEALEVAGGTLYVVGGSTNAGGSPATYIAQWNGTNWSALGSGLNSFVGPVAVLGRTLYAGGYFTNAGGTPANYIAKWNGTNWSALGSGLNSYVSAMAVSGNTLYLGGNFTTADGQKALFVAQWNGSRLSQVGDGLTGPVSALAVSGSTLYAAVNTLAADGPATYLALWNGSKWSVLNSRISGGGSDGYGPSINALAVSGSTLFAGGDFSNAGDDTNANNMAEWNGTTWSGAGSGMNGVVNALVVSGGTLYAGGNFTTAGTNVSAYMAEASLAGTAASYRITVSASPNAGGAISGGGTFASGSIRTVTAGANSGYTFSNWTENGSLVSSNSSYTFIVDEDQTLVANFAIKGNPELTITSPKAGQSIAGSNYIFNVAGTTTDKLSVTNVSYQVNGGSWTSAMPSNSWSNWTASVTLNPGLNTISAYAVDTTGSFSPTNTVKFQFIPSATLIVETNGFGGITPVDNNKLLAIGTNYTLTASPGKNWIFSNWVAGGSGDFVSTNPVLKFAMQSNLTLTANFVTNVFLAAQGTYNGLFAPTSAPRQQTNSGAISFTVSSAGVLSGKLTLGTNTPSLSGQFNPAGAATITTPRKGLSNLTTSLQLVFTNQSVQGTVGDGAFSASIIGDQAVFTSNRKAIHFQGQYTFIIPGTNDPTVGPFGASYGTVTVAPGGTITFSGSRADGTAFGPMTSVVSQGGYWPFYVPLYGGAGSLWGWNLFSNQTLLPAPSLSWINATNTAKTAEYRAGFTNQAAMMVASAYSQTNKPLLALSNGQVILDSSSGTFVLTNQIALASNDAITLIPLAQAPENTNKLVLTINKTTGVITGSFANPSNPKQTIAIAGVLLQNQTNAAGYFIGTNQGGSFAIEAP